MKVNKTKLPATKGFTIVHCSLWNIVHGSNLYWNRRILPSVDQQCSAIIKQRWGTGQGMGPNLPLHLPCITGSRTFILGLFLPLALLRLRHIKPCCVIPTPLNSPFSHLFRTPTPAIYSPVSRTPPAPFSPRLSLCPLPLFFFFQSVAWQLWERSCKKSMESREILLWWTVRRSAYYSSSQ